MMQWPFALFADVPVAVFVFGDFHRAILNYCFALLTSAPSVMP
jgi:hypothetical protein